MAALSLLFLKRTKGRVLFFLSGSQSMKAAGVKELKKELGQCTPQELLEICLRLSKFKKENKELLTYLLFESYDEPAYIEKVKQELDEQFDQINRGNIYFIKKSTRKILRNLKKYTRYSSKKETEVELLFYFCEKLKSFSASVRRDKVLNSLYDRQVLQIKKTILSLHEDLQYDYETELQDLGPLSR